MLRNTILLVFLVLTAVAASPPIYNGSINVPPTGFTSINAPLIVNSGVSLTTLGTGCVQLGTGGIASTTGTNCGVGGSGITSVAATSPLASMCASGTCTVSLSTPLPQTYGGTGSSTGNWSASNITLTGQISTGSIYNVYNSGAACNGITDDTSALNSALSSAAGKGTVYVPPNCTILVSSGISIPSNSRLEIDGTITGNVPSTMLLGVGVNACNVAVSNVFIWGSGTVSSTYTSGGGGITETIGLCHANNVYIFGGLNIAATTGASSPNAPLEATNSSNVHLSYINITGGNTAPGCNGAGFGSAPLYTFNCFLDHVTISSSADSDWAFYNGCVNCSITESNIYNTTSSAAVIVLTDTAGEASPNKQILIANNQIHNNAYDGVEVLCYSGCGTQYPKNVTISNNQIYSNGGSGVDIYNSQQVTIEGNDIHNDTGNGVFLQVAAQYVNVVGNRIGNEGQGGTSGVGIQLTGTSGYPLNNVNIQNNLIYDDQATATMQYGISSNGAYVNYTQLIGNTCQANNGPLVTTTFPNTNCINANLSPDTEQNPNGLNVYGPVAASLSAHTKTGYLPLLLNGATGASLGNNSVVYALKQPIPINPAGCCGGLDTSYTWTFPQAFTFGEAVTCTTDNSYTAGVSGGFNVSIASSSLSSVTLNLYVASTVTTPGGTVATIYLNCIAVGG